MQFDIELSFKADASPWLEAFLEPDGRVLCHFPDDLICKISNCNWTTFLDAGRSGFIGFLESLRLLDDGSLELLILVGSEGPELIERVMRRLYSQGCRNLSAFLYADECEVVVTEDGIEHRCGLHYFFDKGVLKCQDYPEIVNQYF